jgi:hypothetical protein
MPSINAKEEIYKILKYQKKMQEQSGGGSKNENYREKIKEHKQNLIGANYKKEEIEHMIQKGGAALDDLMKKFDKTVADIGVIADKKCKEEEVLKKELEKEIHGLKTATVTIEELKKSNEDLDTMRRNISEKHDALVESHAIQQSTHTGMYEANIMKAEEALQKILIKLEKCTPPENPEMVQ